MPSVRAEEVYAVGTRQLPGGGVAVVTLIRWAAVDPNAEAARWLRDVMTSWPAQAVIVALYVGLAVLAFTRVARDWDDGPRKRYFRAAVVALGVFLLLEVVLGRALLAFVVWPAWLYLIELLVLFGLWLYYFVRFMTRQRSGPGDPESVRRGAALDETLSRVEQERRVGAAGGGPGAASGAADAPR
jgi:small-conductance mechanosensitive channel